MGRSERRNLCKLIALGAASGCLQMALAPHLGSHAGLGLEFFTGGAALPLTAFIGASASGRRERARVAGFMVVMAAARTSGALHLPLWALLCAAAAGCAGGAGAFLLGARDARQEAER